MSSDQTSRSRPTMASLVGEIARPTPVSVPPSASITEAISLMATNRVGSIVVMCGDGIPVGIVTMQDVLMRIALPQVEQSLPISAIMTLDPVTIPENTTIHRAAHVMATKNLRHLLIVRSNQTLAGVISKNDIYSLLCSACVTARTALVTRELAQA